MSELFDEISSYLRGEKFSNALKINLKYQKMKYKFDLLKELSAGKKIIHVGFADHPELITQKVKRDVWLHSHLYKIASKCLGIDINCSAVRFVKETYGIDNVFCVDITKKFQKNWQANIGM